METIGQSWSEIKLRVNIKTTLEKAYEAVATARGLESWFLRRAKFEPPTGEKREHGQRLVKGDTYQWNWHGHSDEVSQTGTVLEANGKNVFAFSFSLNCPVTIKIYLERDQVIVDLLEADIPINESTIFKNYLNNTTGWVFYLTNLKSVLEGGLDLRNVDPSLKNVITA